MNFNRIPAELQQWPNWILWKLETLEDGRTTKVPYSIRGTLASVTDPNTWANFSDVLSAYNAGGYSGIGFVFSRRDPFCGVDLDGTTDPAIVAVQEKIYKGFNTYNERSPSGTGLHIICKAVLPAGRRRSKVEIYSHDRFFTMTGDQFGPINEVRDCQAVAEILYNELGVGVQQHHFDGNAIETETDESILQKALAAANGDKFSRLLTGDWGSDYSSQSEADFSFINIVAFYTQNKDQIKRIFRASPLGQRPKAWRDNYVDPMIQRSFDRMLPPLDMAGLYNAIEAQIADMTAAQPLGAATPAPEPAPEAITYPRGLVGDIARYVYSASPRPVHEISIAAALGLMAGIVGRSFNVSATGLNSYFLLLANTGVGKEAMSSGINRLINAVSTLNPQSGASATPSARNFIGPSEIASAPALFKSLVKQPVMVSITGEFGLKLQAMASEKASPNDVLLKRALLALYGISGRGQVWHGMNYSDKEKNVEAIQSPAFSMLAESTPETFLQAVDEKMVTDGLLPRFLIIEYTGKRMPLNDHHGQTWPSNELIDRVGSLVVQAHAIATTGQPIEVLLDPEAMELAKSFNDYCDTKINASETEVLRHLWSRAYMKLLKVAALVAVGANPLSPVITRDDFMWAYSLVNNDVQRLISRFEKGEVGGVSASDNMRQMKDMFKIMFAFTTQPYDALKAYRVTQLAHDKKMIPHSFLLQRLQTTASFKSDRLGSTNAIKNTIATFIEAGIIRKVPPMQVTNELGVTGSHYVLVNLHWAG